MVDSMTAGHPDPVVAKQASAPTLDSFYEVSVLCCVALGCYLPSKLPCEQERVYFIFSQDCIKFVENIIFHMSVNWSTSCTKQKWLGTAGKQQQNLRERRVSSKTTTADGVLFV